MKTRKRKKKKKKETQSPENPRVFQRPPSFAEPTRNDGHSTPTISPASSEHLQREKREKISREREISDKRRRVFSFSDEPSNHP